MHIVFWIAVALLVYTYLGYAAVIWVWAALQTHRARWDDLEPSVSLLIVAYNEARNIEARLQNVLSLDYPRDRFEILVGSDGSTDRTTVLARAYERIGVTVVAFEARRGKAAVLNKLVARARGEVVVFTDARQRFEPGAVRALVRRFADPAVGAVSGELILTPNSAEGAVDTGAGFYWRYEKFIRRFESRVDSTVGATGAIYAIRRVLYEPLPDDTILDDVLIPLRIARRGYRVVFESLARAFDRAAISTSGELARKVRTLAGNFQLFARERWLLSPFQNRLWFQTVSHKGLRLVAPLLQGTALATNLLLAAEPRYRLLLAAQLLFYAAALGGYALREAKQRTPIFTVPYAVCLFAWATMVGFIRFVTGRQRVTWEKHGS